MFRKSIRLPREYYVRVFSSDYSVDPSAIGRIVDVSSDLETVKVTCDGTLLALHERQWARHHVLTDKHHLLKAAELRRAYGCLKKPQSPGVQVRDLSIDDEVFGVDVPDDARHPTGIVP